MQSKAQLPTKLNREPRKLMKIQPLTNKGKEIRRLLKGHGVKTRKR